MMKGKFNKTERRGLPGGPNEQFTYITGVFSTHGYKRNSPDVDNPFNVIPSGNITMKDVDFPVHGVDNLGNEQMMYPGGEYQFPGDMVYETPIAQDGGEFQRLVKKYTTQGWASLTPQEQQFYRETYQRGGSLPRYQSKGEVLTYQNNPEYFDSHAFLSEVGNSPSSIKWSDQIKKKVYAGTHGYNPSTGALTKLDSPQGGAGSLTKAQSKRGARQARVYADNPLAEKPTGMSEEDIAAITHDVRFKDKQALHKNPAFLAPGIIGGLGTIGPAALANPYVQAGLTGYGVYDATTHSIPGAVKATKEGRYLDAAGNTAMASLDLLPIPFFGTNLVGEGKKLGKALTSKVNNQNFGYGIGSFPGTHNPTFYKQNLETITESEKYDRNFADLKYAQEWAKKYDYDFPKNLEDISKSDEATNKIIKDIVDKHNTFARGVVPRIDMDVMPWLQKRKLKKIFEKKNIDYLNDPKALAEYMATHIPVFNTSGARLGLTHLNPKYDALYTTNSKLDASNYTVGQGFTVDVKKPTDFSSFNRRDWIKDNELAYFKDYLPRKYFFKKLPEKILKVAGDDKFAHYAHIGKPGEKIFDAIRSEPITQDHIMKVGHKKPLYTKDYSAASLLPVIGSSAILSNEKEGGSINLDPAKKGTFKALATRYGMSMGKLAMDMKSNPDKYSPGARKKANFYRNFVMQSGGSTNNKQFEIYQNYINGEFDEVSEEEAEKVYDKLNRIYYAEAKKEGMSPANYIMTYVLGNK